MPDLYRISRHGKTLTHIKAVSAVRAAISYALKTGDTDPIKVHLAIREQPYRKPKFIPKKK